MKILGDLFYFLLQSIYTAILFALIIGFPGIFLYLYVTEHTHGLQAVLGTVSAAVSIVFWAGAYSTKYGRAILQWLYRKSNLDF